MATAMESATGKAAETPIYTLRQLVGYALGLGTWGFGGPVALVGYMHRDLVERRQWISEAEYKEGLTLAQIMPGRSRLSCRYIWAPCITACSALSKQLRSFVLLPGGNVMRCFTVVLVSLVVAIAAASGADLSADSIGAVVGVKATTTPDGVIRVGWARKDVPVAVDGTKLKTFAGLGSWAAFQRSEHGAMVMGDTVLFQDEVNPAMDAAFANGLEVTALHNHFFFDEPKVYFMHIGGMGDADKLANGVKAVWDAAKKVRSANNKPAAAFDRESVNGEGSLNQDALAKMFTVKPAVEEGIVKFTIGRDSEMHGLKFGGSLGLTTWIAFIGNDEHAAIDGDVAMTANEVQSVLQALRKEKINVVAMHNHMVGEKPAYFFVHFWGKGRADALATSFQKVLEAQMTAGNIAVKGH